MKDEGTAVLVIGFNRFEKIRRVIQALSKQKVSKLYVWLDGPRTGTSDVAEQRNIRKFLGDCALPFPMERSFQPANLGCGRSVAGAVSWFFSEEEFGAILEDDCVPSGDFIEFIAKQRSRWESDRDVMTISGHSLLMEWPDPQSSYHFSKYPHIWGWGTWRRVWRDYDSRIRLWGELRNTDWLRAEVGLGRDAARLWSHRFNQVYNGIVDTWDYQMTFLSFVNGGRNLIPHRNMIENIGFGPQASHTFTSLGGLATTHQNVGQITNPLTSRIDDTLDRKIEIEAHRVKRPIAEMVRLAVRYWMSNQKKHISGFARLWSGGALQ